MNGNINIGQIMSSKWMFVCGQVFVWNGGVFWNQSTDVWGGAFSICISLTGSVILWRQYWLSGSQ